MAFIMGLCEELTCLPTPGELVTMARVCKAHLLCAQFTHVQQSCAARAEPARPLLSSALAQISGANLTLQQF